LFENCVLGKGNFLKLNQRSRCPGRSSKFQGSWHALVKLDRSLNLNASILAAQHSSTLQHTNKLAAFAYHPSRMLAKRLPRCSLRPTPRFLTTSRSLRAGDPLHTHPGSSGGHHGDHYDPPGGWLWGLRPGEKYEKEGWEGLFYYGFYGSFVVAAIAYAFKPDTS
jgi:hypothetical protein